jgi:hypothetical protein
MAARPARQPGEVYRGCSIAARREGAGSDPISAVRVRHTDTQADSAELRGGPRSPAAASNHAWATGTAVDHHARRPRTGRAVEEQWSGSRTPASVLPDRQRVHPNYSTGSRSIRSRSTTTSSDVGGPSRRIPRPARATSTGHGERRTANGGDSAPRHSATRRLGSGDSDPATRIRRLGDSDPATRRLGFGGSPSAFG